MKYATKKIGDKVLHYSCNSPSQEVCDKHGIETIWQKFWRAAREFLLIPFKLFQKKGKDVSVVSAEQLMRDLSK